MPLPHTAEHTPHCDATNIGGVCGADDKDTEGVSDGDSVGVGVTDIVRDIEIVCVAVTVGDGVVVTVSLGVGLGVGDVDAQIGRGDADGDGVASAATTMKHSQTKNTL